MSFVNFLRIIREIGRSSVLDSVLRIVSVKNVKVKRNYTVKFYSNVKPIPINP